VSDAKQAKRYFVSGFVQGVGFRNFVHHAAERLDLQGYVRNLPDGRVEAYAIGPSGDLAKLRAFLERGPRLANVSEVLEEPAEIDSRYAGDFTITFGD
jgi:acylphosphatase